MIRYRARCNKRPCQARKTIKGVYDPNDRRPCHVPGCKGLMRKDVTRERDCTRDATGGGELCRCDGLEMSIRNSPHRRGSKGCKHFEDVKVEQSLRPVPKHSPRRPYEPEGEPSF